MPPNPTRTRAKAGGDTARLSIADLTPEEIDALKAEIREEQTRPHPGLEPRELTPRERAIRLLLPERAHLDGCPLVTDERASAGRVEASNEVRPPDPTRGRAAAPVTSVRCMECGGSKVLDGNLHDNLLAALEGAGIAAGLELDTNL